MKLRLSSICVSKYLKHPTISTGWSQRVSGWGGSSVQNEFLCFVNEELSFHHSSPKLMPSSFFQKCSIHHVTTDVQYSPEHEIVFHSPLLLSKSCRTAQIKKRIVDSLYCFLIECDYRGIENVAFCIFTYCMC